jgi:protein-export membrane protein SecD
MLKVAPWRMIVVLVTMVLGLLFALPNFIPETVRKQIPVISALRPINLGLDLRGGSHLLLEVNVASLQHQQLETVVDDMARVLREAEPRIAYTGRGVQGDAARLRIVNPADADRALRELEKSLIQQVDAGGLGNTEANYALTKTDDGVIEARFGRAALEAVTRRAVDQSQEVIRRRVDPTGTSEVSIARQGADRIVVQAPGETDPESLKRRIGQTARLTFHLLDTNASPADAQAGRAPPGSEIVAQPDRPDEPFIVIKSRALLSGDDLNRADPSFDQRTGEPNVSFVFDGRGTRVFCQVTQQNVDQRFAAVLDGKVITAPSINEPICGGRGQITGNFTVESAKELADLLNAGALPAPLRIIEERSVTAELGQDAISAGSIAGVIAGVGVLVFMVLMYGLFGLFACVALVVNGVLILAAMSAVGAALTLPGIAGLILTLAAAVDANVLIYERMREEAEQGRGPALAIDAGFSRAMITIIDANLTTILAALILFQFGAGPVRGFAWTLSIGVITSVFTAVLITQILIAWWFRAARPKTLPI